MRRVLLDQGLAPRAAALLRAEGWDALHVIEAGLDHAQDGEILAFALAENRVCVTLDHDFHVHLALAKAVAPSVPRSWVDPLRNCFVPPKGRFPLGTRLEQLGTKEGR